MSTTEQPQEGMPQVEVEVRLTDGKVYSGVVHVPMDVRVLDFMNDPTPFFALLEETGKVRILAKSQVVQVIPFDTQRSQAPAQP